MKLAILAVGHRLPGWAAEGCEEYLKRLPRELPASIIEIKPEPRVGKTRAQLLAAEKTRLLAALPGHARTVVLDERGEDLHTQQLAHCLQGWMREGGDTAFVIGSADGLDEEIKRRANMALRLSSLTLPHALARLVLCEQLYRAISLIKNHPYHREG